MPALRRSPQPFISVAASSAFAPLVRSEPYPSAFVAPKAQSVTQITYGAAFSSYVPDHEMYPFGRRRDAMTWTSDRTGVLLYAILGTLFVMSWIYIPA
jgi:hypothetical protein